MSKKSYRDISVSKITLLDDYKGEEITYCIYSNEGDIENIEHGKLVRLVDVIQEILKK